MKKIVALWLGIAFVIVACTEVLDIKVSDASGTPIFNLHRKNTEEPPRIWSVLVVTGLRGERKTIWHIETPMRSERDTSQDALILQTLTFGVIPSGFIQYEPTNGNIPKLEQGLEYNILVSGNASGVASFVH